MIRYKTSDHSRILFVGINPHHGSFRRGVPFSNNKTFWYLLNRAGVLAENESDLRSDRGLKNIYETRFLQHYKLNFVNLINHPTAQVTELKRGDELPGVRRVLKLIHKRRPRVVCFIGRVTYQKFLGSNNFGFGWQEPIGFSQVFVMHFPIRGSAAVRIRELKQILRAVSGGVTSTGDWQGTGDPVS
jgi:TDG/mug DNA glycosylase family protein